MYTVHALVSLKTRPFATEEEGSGHVPTFELSPQNAIMRGYNYGLVAIPCVRSLQTSSLLPQLLPNTWE